LNKGEIGPDLFRKACEFGLEGLVSKHRERAYRAGAAPHWIKVKNPAHPAMNRVKDAHGLGLDLSPSKMMRRRNTLRKVGCDG
jgi:hypothetical protein